MIIIDQDKQDMQELDRVIKDYQSRGGEYAELPWDLDNFRRSGCEGTITSDVFYFRRSGISVKLFVKYATSLKYLCSLLMYLLIRLIKQR
jgi:hypothetical protein